MKTKAKAPQRTMNATRPHHTTKYYTTLWNVVKTIFQVVGCFLFLIGGSAMDSESLVLPIAALAAGAALLFITTKGDF